MSYPWCDSNYKISLILGGGRDSWKSGIPICKRIMLVSFLTKK